MIKLINNCRYSEPSVHPKGYKGTSVKLLNEKWYIKYRFYDDNIGRSKQIQIKANDLGDLRQRQEFIKETLAGIKQALEVNGWNPITKKSITEYTPTTKDINTFTPLVEALKFARKSLKLSNYTMRDIDGIILSAEAAIKALGFEHLNVGSITRKHMRSILDKCSILKKGGISNDKFNRHRTYLGILYNELVEFEVVEANIPLSVSTKKREAKKEKQLFTRAERTAIIEHLEKSNPRFLLFIQIFFSSGARLTEMLRLKVKDVDFTNQYITYLVLKGKQYEYKQRPMVDIAVGLWSDAIYGANPDDYVWGKRLLAGAEPAGQYVVKMKWQRLQKKLGILKGMYGLKHTNSTEVADMVGTEGVMTLNAESRSMIESVYDTKHKKRKDDTIKGVNNKF